MEAILQEHNNTMPAREVLVSLADKFRYVLVFLRLKKFKHYLKPFSYY